MKLKHSYLYKTMLHIVNVRPSGERPSGSAPVLGQIEGGVLMVWLRNLPLLRRASLFLS